MLDAAYFRPFEHENTPKLANDLNHVAELLLQFCEEYSAVSEPRLASEISVRSSILILEATRMLIADREKRDVEFSAGIFADPVWDILLGLFVAELEQKHVSVSSSVLAAKVPLTTGLRYIRQMELSDLIYRTPAPFDGRKTYISLTQSTSQKMQFYVEGVVNRWLSYITAGKITKLL